MAEREDNVYKAKLAEQAERYDGKEGRCKGQRRARVSSLAPATGDLSHGISTS